MGRREVSDRRLWYSQLDMYDCARRLCSILHCSGQPLHLERLYILDFYFATPALIARTRMRSEVRREFRFLEIEKPENGFLTLPAEQLLFHQMEPIQRQAKQSLIGKALVRECKADHRSIELSSEGRSLFEESFGPITPPKEVRLLKFLVDSFGGQNCIGLQQLRESTGLRRAAT